MTNIYLITNKITGQRYVGKTVKRIQERFKEHCRGDTNTYIDNALKAHGPDNFTLELLHVCDDSEWKYWEAYYISEMHSHWSEGGYNLSRGGDHNPMEDDEVRRRHAEAVASPEHRERLRIAGTGRYHTAESKKKMREIQKAVYSDPELRRKVKLRQPTVMSVQMLDDNGDVIRTFESLSDVCKFFGKDIGNTSSLSKMVDKYNKNGKRAKFWGHAWTRIKLEV